MRVTVLVVDAGGNDGHVWLDERQEGIGRSRIGPMVADFQHVDRPQQPPRGKQRLDGRLRVPGQQGTEAPIPQDGHD